MNDMEQKILDLVAERQHVSFVEIKRLLGEDSRGEIWLSLPKSQCHSLAQHEPGYGRCPSRSDQNGQALCASLLGACLFRGWRKSEPAASETGQTI